MLFLERGFVFVLTGKEKRLWTPSRWHGSEVTGEDSPEDFGYRKERFEENQTGQAT